MKSHIKTIKNLICYLVAFILVITANIGLLSTFKTDIDTAFAYKGYDDISLNNQNFNTNTSTDYPYAPNGWTASVEENENVDAGIINLDEEDYQTYTKNNNSNDNYVLMIDSKEHNTNFSYTSDNDITLDADGYYSISVDVYTNNTDGIASIYLLDDESKEFASLTNKSSKNNWTTYTFFVRTNDIESVSLKLKLALNGNGVVLYDNVAINELNKDTYELRKSAITTSTLYTEINLVDNVIENYAIGNFFSQTDSETNNVEYSTASYVTVAEDSNASDGSNNSAFKIENKKATYVEYATADDFFVFYQNSIQKVTVTLKATGLSGKATLQLVETNLDDDATGNDLTSISINSNTSSELELDNDFVKYSFYVKGYPTKEAHYKLVVRLGDTDNKTTGTIYISNITISKTTDSIYSNVSTGTTAEKMDLSANYTYTDQDFILNNGNFNAITIEDYNKTYPYTPTAWTVTEGEKYQQYGVINTANLSEIDNLNVHVGDPDGNLGSAGGNNVLMMYNATADTLSYTSATKSLDKKTYHKFSLQLQTQDAPATVSLVSTKDDNEIVLSSITVDTDYEWKNVELYLYTGYQAYDVSLKITLDSDASAYAFVDNSMYNYYFDQTQEEFDAINNTKYIVKTDLTKIIAADSNEHYSTPTNFVGSGSENVEYKGVVNLDGENLANYVISNADYVDTFKSLAGDNRNVLAIRSLTDANYTYTSNIGFKLTANSYYKISVSVYTQNLQILDTEKEQDLKGATIKLTGFDETFTKIVSDNEWTTYTFYICPNNDVTTYLQLSLGGDVACTGDVFFGNISFVDEGISSLDNIKANATTLVLNKTTETTTDGDDDTDDDTNSNDNSNSSAWIYAIPSVLTALAILIALVGVMMRKVKIKKPTKKSKNKTEYDRKTVSKQIYMRKATTLREEKLREANAELDALHAERTKYEEDYKHGLTKLRELKLKRITGSEVIKIEKEIKRNQKASSAIGLNINKLENEIEYMRTDSYLNSLMKKLANEKQTEEADTDNK